MSSEYRVVWERDEEWVNKLDTFDLQKRNVCLFSNAFLAMFSDMS